MRRSPERMSATVTDRTVSSSPASAATGRCSVSSVSRPAERYGAIMASRTASATRGSWQSLLTRPAPGLRLRRARASERIGYHCR